MFAPMSRKQASPSAFPKTHFGFHEVAEWEKAPRVRGVFTSVARRYDLMNDLMSGGIHRRWKNEMVALLRPRADWQVIDVAGGTGDIALRILDRLGPRGQVVICDLTEEMLQVGRDRAIDSGRLERLQWVQGDAQQLPFPDRSFDAYSIAFG